MKQKLVNEVIQGMLPYLNNAQTEKLQAVMQHALWNYELSSIQNNDDKPQENFVELFLSAKRIEGCSDKSLKYYESTIQAMLDKLD